MKPDTRTAILDAAEELIQARGRNGISYQTISDIVGIRKASIHHHFSSKERLVEEVIRRYSARFLAQVDAIVESPARPAAKLRHYSGLFETTLRRSGGRVCLCGMLGAELASLGSPAVSLLRDFYRQNAKRLGTILAQGRKDGTFRFRGGVSSLGMLVFSSLEGAMLVCRADGGAKQFEGLRQQLARLVRC